MTFSGVHFWTSTGKIPLSNECLRTILNMSTKRDCVTITVCVKKQNTNKQMYKLFHNTKKCKVDITKENKYTQGK